MTGRLRAPAALIALLAWGSAVAHVPFFPTGGDAVVVEEPAVSKAYYVHGSIGTEQAFEIVAVDRSVPLQVLVLDDEAGRRARWRAELDCGAERVPLRAVDVPFYEPFSGLEHRIVAVGSLGPSDDTCELHIAQTAGAGVPYTVVVGDEERFRFTDVLGLLDLPRKLERWREGR